MLTHAEAEGWRRYATRLRHEHADRRIVVENGRVKSSGALIDTAVAGLLIYLPIELIETVSGAHLDVLHQLEVVAARKLSRSRPMRVVRNHFESGFNKAVGPTIVAAYDKWHSERVQTIRRRVTPAWHRTMSKPLARPTGRMSLAVTGSVAMAFSFGLPIILFGFVIPTVAVAGYDGGSHLLNNVRERRTHLSRRSNRHANVFDPAGTPHVVSLQRPDPWWCVRSRSRQRLSDRRVQHVKSVLLGGIEADKVAMAKLERILQETLRRSSEGKVFCCAGKRGTEVGPFRLAVALQEIIETTGDDPGLLIDRLHRLSPEAAHVLAAFDRHRKGYDKCGHEQDADETREQHEAHKDHEVEEGRRQHDHATHNEVGPKVAHAGHHHAHGKQKGKSWKTWFSKGRHRAQERSWHRPMMRIVTALTMFATAVVVPSSESAEQRLSTPPSGANDRSTSQHHTSQMRGERSTADELRAKIARANHETRVSRIDERTEAHSVTGYRQTLLDAAEAAVDLGQRSDAQRMTSTLHWTMNRGVTSTPSPEVGQRVEDTANAWSRGSTDAQQAKADLGDLGLSIGLR